MVRNVKRIIERHPLTKGLKPDNPAQWAEDRFTVRRAKVSRDPSMQAKGVSSNITGSHADVVICDDVEVPNTSDSAEKREDLRERLREIAYVLTAGGTQLYVGTPHDYYSIYADCPREEIGEELSFLNGFERLALPLLNEEEECLWPEKYSPEDIEKIKIETGPNKFESQMMLRETNIMDGRLDADLLRYYEDDLAHCVLTNKYFIGSAEIVTSSAWWDPAFGKKSGDSSVLAVVFGDAGGNYYIHHTEYIRVDQLLRESEAVQQCKAIAQIARDYRLPNITVEKNGIGNFLPRILNNTLENMKIPTRIRDVATRKSKEYRILEAFDALLAAERIFVHKNVQKTPFVMEMREWKPGKSRARDDGLDAVAGAINQSPDRLASKPRTGSYAWPHSLPSKAKSDFDV